MLFLLIVLLKHVKIAAGYKLDFSSLSRERSGILVFSIETKPGIVRSVQSVSGFLIFIEF